MMETDVIGQALVRAFAQRGLEATLPDPSTISIRLAGGASANADIGSWREHALSYGPAGLEEAAAAYAEQAAKAFERASADVPEADLRVRLYPEEALGGMLDALVARRLAPGLVEAVVIDYPDSIAPLDRSRLGDLPEESVFGGALARSIDDEPHYRESATVHGVPVTHVGGAHRYVGAHVHVLRRHTGQAPRGALVSFPLPEYMLVHEIGDVHLFAAMEALQELSQRLFESGDKPISPRLYWWRPGAYEEQPHPQALHGPLLPDLRPVGIRIDHREKSVSFLTEDTNELVELWMRDHE
ncbi:unnamed protein product [[Actinomadura] parvosata subsp. kistnae]|uniref:Uncharacterized protein n=1 Tax=[Actinomadura] parvosata subsp. kistnae TaxID=1909395 RepID=A0A1V0A158_9ACTN|nr:hypothetical protein [Nonomuraea sp. ATCC 55076]AQZ63944.1 hypothetical protein BKM31_22985 [Nonomuraea sp. ATCC 55076]SPL89802.1 unnamed protein product [Actinomadura parvosata subsp. kistnae]